MENENNFGVVLKKITKWVGTFALVLAFLIWVMLDARFSANYSWVMPVREWYLDRIVIARALPDNLPHTIQPKQKADEGYWYEMWGRLVSVDYASYTMTISSIFRIEL